MVREIPIPENMQLNELSDKLEFRYNWFKPKYIVSLLAAPIFSYFLVTSDYVIGDFSNFTVSVIALTIFTLIVVYYSLAKVANTTTIDVTHDELDVKHGPIPFSKNLQLKKKDVTQLYVTQHRIGHRYYLYSTTFQINVILTNGDIITLVKGLNSAEQGRFIEHKIEDFLGITDIHVEGEIAKD